MAYRVEFSRRASRDLDALYVERNAAESEAASPSPLRPLASHSLRDRATSLSLCCCEVFLRIGIEAGFVLVRAEIVGLAVVHGLG